MRNFYILLTAVIFICGIILTSFGLFASFSPTIFIISIAILFGLLVLSIKREFFFLAFLFLLVFILGIIRYNTHNMIDKYHIKNYTPFSQEKILVKGRVVSDPRERPKRRKRTFILETHSVKSEEFWERANGLVLASLYGSDIPTFQYGDIVVLEGSLWRPFSYKKQTNFDYREYLANKRIYSILSVKKGFFSKKIGQDRRIITQFMRTTYSVRAKLESHIEKNLSPPQSSILAAILLGRRQKIPFWIRDLFAKTGTLHILAISGLHVGIIYFGLRIVLNIFRIRRNLSIILSVSFLICYAILTGSRPSILRATIMFSILGLGQILKRKIGVFNLIGLSGLVILMTNPNQIFDVGFILSYTAVLSIVFISPLCYRMLSVGERLSRSSPLWRKAKHYLLRSISVSLAVWLGLQPLIAYYFGLISPIVIIANLVVIPLTFILMGSGILLLSLGFLSKLLGAIFSQSAWFFISVLINCIKFLKNIPLSYFEIKPPHPFIIILYYLALLIIVKAFKSKKLTFLFLT